VKHIQNNDVDNKESDANEDNVMTGGKLNKFVHVTLHEPDTNMYEVDNDRKTCDNMPNKQSCHENIHCHWTHSGCLMQLTVDVAIEYINKISIEIASKEIKAMEILKISDYYVSNIVDMNRYTERKNQKIIQSTGSNIKKTLNDIFGKDNVPQIGKRRGQKTTEDETYELNTLNQIKNLRDMYVQSVIPQNMTIFRAYVNGYYWLKNSYYDIDNRNLGYYSDLQTDLSNYFKSIVLDWLIDDANSNIIQNKLLKYIVVKKNSKNLVEQITTKLITGTQTYTNCIIELFILNQLQHVPIVVYNENNSVIYLFDDELIDNKNGKNQSKIDDLLNKNNKLNVINLRFIFFTNNLIPDDIEVLYFKNFKKK
jgi:hypothetical protein